MAASRGQHLEQRPKTRHVGRRQPASNCLSSKGSNDITPSGRQTSRLFLIGHKTQRPLDMADVRAQHPFRECATACFGCDAVESVLSAGTLLGP